MYKNYGFDGSGHFDLDQLKTKPPKSLDKEAIKAQTAQNIVEMQQLQDRLYAQGQEGLIIIFQARDAAGKDGTIKHVMSGINPQGVTVYSFKTPSHAELAHDFLWRFNNAIPERGRISIFNRSYYEDVLIVKVRELYKNYNVPERSKDDSIFAKRYREICDYERYLYENGYRIIKFFLNVSAKEQKKRFLQRIDEPEKNWKFSEADIAERALWPQYTEAYQSAIEHTASKEAPWYIIPADKKWFMRYLVSEAILDTLRAMDPQYPILDVHQKDKLKLYKEQLENEGAITKGARLDKQEKKAVNKELERS